MTWRVYMHFCGSGTCKNMFLKNRDVVGLRFLKPFHDHATKKRQEISGNININQNVSAVKYIQRVFDGDICISTGKRKEKSK